MVIQEKKRIIPINGHYLAKFTIIAILLTLVFVQYSGTWGLQSQINSDADIIGNSMQDLGSRDSFKGYETSPNDIYSLNSETIFQTPANHGPKVNGVQRAHIGVDQYIDGLRHTMQNQSADASRSNPQYFRSPGVYENHLPISIDNNTDFLAQAVLEGWSGTGTQNDPLLISGYEISNSSKSLIDIKNTDLYFQITSNNLNGISRNGWAGIYLENVIHARIKDNTIQETSYGIILNSSDYNSVKNNTIEENNEPMGLLASNNNIITNNSLENNFGNLFLYNSSLNTIANNSISGNDGGYGIYLSFSGDNNLVGNMLENHSFGFYSDEASDALQTMVVDNTVNGKPLIWWQQVHGGTVPTGVGQVVLVSCTQVEVVDHQITGVGAAILAAFSSELTIHNNTITNSTFIAIGLLVSTNNVITNNTLENNPDSIRLDNSSLNTIANNSISGNDGGFGINLLYSGDNSLVGNVLETYSIGLYSNEASDALQTMVVDNTVNGKPLIWWQQVHGGTVPTGVGQVVLVSCTQVEVVNHQITGVSAAILAAFCSELVIHDNTITNSVYPAINLVGSVNSNIVNNTVSNNQQGIWLDLSSQNIVSKNNITNNIEIGIGLMEDATNNTVESNILEGNGYTGILLWNAANNTIVNNIVNNNQIVGIELQFSTENIISKNNITFNVWRGIGLIEGANNNIIKENIVKNNLDLGILLWYRADNNTIRENIVEENRNIGIFLGDVGNNSVVNNTANNNQVDGIALQFSSQNVISKNIAINNARRGIGLYSNTTNNTVRDNIVERNIDMGIILWLATNNSVLNNTINDSPYGIYSGNSTNNVLSSNNIKDISVNTVYLSYSNTTIISKNTLLRSSGEGITLFYSENNTISSNSIANQTSYGIRLISSSNNILLSNIIVDNGGFQCISLVKWDDPTDSNRLLNNTIIHCGGTGIFIYMAVDTEILNNTVIDSSYYCISVLDSWETLVKWNDFINNATLNTTLPITSQAKEFGGVLNTFEYNFWSNWTSPDANGDGIVDNPYEIESDKKTYDPYPMVRPNNLRNQEYYSSVSIPASVQAPSAGFFVTLSAISTLILILHRRKKK
ncbi:MAG: nitrous oxide reductase family maturation protein NosD [Promethearchaeota archaeon]